MRPVKPQRSRPCRPRTKRDPAPPAVSPSTRATGSRLAPAERVNLKRLAPRARRCARRSPRARRLARLQHADQSAVAQNRRAVGDLHHLADVVADEDDARAFARRCGARARTIWSTPTRGRNGVGSSSTSRRPAAALGARRDPRPRARWRTSPARPGERLATGAARIEDQARNARERLADGGVFAPPRRCASPARWRAASGENSRSPTASGSAPDSDGRRPGPATWRPPPRTGRGRS